MSAPPLILARNSHGGIGWPTGAVKDLSTGRERNEALYELLTNGAPSVILEPEARWHYTEAAMRLPDSLLMWRCVPQRGFRPAEIGWDGQRLADHVFHNIRWHVTERGGIYPRDIMLINEPSLNYERGDNLNDTDPSTWRYVLENSANIQGAARHWLINKYGLTNTRFWFAAWSPGHGHWDHTDLWVHVAKTFDGVVFHEYGTAEGIEAEYRRYRDTFGPDIQLQLGEYNTDPNVFPGGNDEAARHEEDKRIKDKLGEIRAADPKFSAVYFIYEWVGGDRQAMNIVGYPERAALFPYPPVEEVAQPPVVVEPDPPPVVVEPEPQPEPAVNAWEFWSAEEMTDALIVERGEDRATILANVEEHWPRVAAQMVLCGIWRRPVAIGLAATMKIETGEFAPVDEGYFLGEPAATRHREGLWYYPWFGRGDVQLTHLRNYELYTRKLAELWGPGAPDLVANPEAAKDGDVAAAVIAMWFRDTRALPTASYPGGYSLLEACDERDWEWCRILVQGGTAKLTEFSAIANNLVALNEPAEPEPPIIWDATPLAAHEIPSLYGTRAIWFWEYNAASLGTVENLAARIKAQGYDAVYIKAGNGGYASPESGSVRWPKQWNATFINAFRSAGLKVVPWVYLYAYGKDANGDTWMGPTAEADMLPWVRKVYADATGEECPVILDAEYELIGQEQGCREFSRRVKEHGIPRRMLSYAPDFRIAFGNRWPTIRTVRPDGGNFPWAVFNDLCGYVQPQTYYHMFGLSLQEGSYALCDAWQAGFPGLDIPVVPIFDQGPDIGAAVQNALDGGYPSISVWAFQIDQAPLYTPKPEPEPDPPPQPEDPPLPGPADPYLLRPDLDETGPNETLNAKPRYFQVIDEGLVAWHHSVEQFRANYWANCGPISMAHVVNMIRWRQNNPTTLNAGDAVVVCEVPLPETVILQTTDPTRSQWVVPAGRFVYGAGNSGVMTYDVFGLGAFAKLLTGIDMICQSTEQWMPGPALSWAAALEIAKTRPIVVNKPGHIAAVIRDKGGRDLLWLVQGNIGPSFNGDGGALTAANWSQWNWQTWYPAQPLWGVAQADAVEDLTVSQRAEYEARIAHLTAQLTDLQSRQDALVTGLGLASGDYADTLLASARKLGTEAARLNDVTIALSKLTSKENVKARETVAAVQKRVGEIASGEIIPVVSTMRGLKPPV